MGCVFLFFGMVGPLTARYMSEIMVWALESDPATAGMDFSAMLQAPTALDSWAQFFGGNIGQIGLFVLVIIFSGMLSSELSRGTLTIMLSKGLPRPAVILSKLTNAFIIWTGCYAVAFLVSWWYTVYIFPGDSVPYLFFAMFALWVFGAFLLALTMLAATLLNKSYACLLSVGAVVVVLMTLNWIPQVSKYNPVSLGSFPMQLLSDLATPRHAYPALALTIAGIAFFTALAIIIFNKSKAGKNALILLGALVVSILAIIFIGEEMPRQISLNRHIISEAVIIGQGTEWELSGVLTLPRNVEGKVPAVVLVHGSGAQDMDETIFDNKPFRDIAEHLSSNGIAVIRYNKRTLTHGIRIFEMDYGGFSVWEETIEDAILVANILRADPRIDGDRIYILGHSLGGMLAPRIHAMGGDFAGIIIFAGSPRFLLDISRDQVMALAHATEDEEEKAEILEMRSQMEDEFAMLLTLSDEEVKNTHFNILGNMGWYWKDMYDNPTAAYLEVIDVPFLIMQPEDDIQVLADVDFAMYKELLAGRSNVTFMLYPGLNHLFMPSFGKDISEIMDEYRIKANVDPQVLEDIVQWVKAEK
jgi:dienelactone hydrolase/ABC-type transport system involved in multi-copper enzyme maturation permease subunit